MVERGHDRAYARDPVHTPWYEQMQEDLKDLCTHDVAAALGVEMGEDIGCLLLPSAASQAFC
eukprot:5961050-Lingulodinium_polyedra.AAC.1